MLEQLTHFHFIRPWGLLMLLPAVFIYWQLLRKESSQRQWGSIIRPHLLKHLIVKNAETPRIRPAHVVFVVMLTAILAFAGPVWKRQPSPFTEDTAPLVIALDLSETMNATDIQPTRLERAKHKIRDLLKLRQGSRNALICYAGSAHRVLPLTDDGQIIETYMESVITDMMPLPGKDASQVLILAKQMLSAESMPGTILFITDEIQSQYVDVFTDFNRQQSHKVLVLAVGTEQGGPIKPSENRTQPNRSGQLTFHSMDMNSFRSLSRQTGIEIVQVTVEDDDVQSLTRQIKKQLAAAQALDDNMAWQDEGYWLLFPLAAGILLWFRRGWVIQWDS